MPKAAHASAREAERRRVNEEAEAKARREGLNRMSQLLGRVEALDAERGSVAQGRDRALRDVRAALADMPPLPSQTGFRAGQRAPEGGAGGAGAERAASCARSPTGSAGRTSASRNSCARRWRRSRRRDRSRSDRAPVHELQQQWRPAADVPRAAGRGAVAALQGRARRGLGALRGALRRAGARARREPGEEGRALRAGRSARRLDRLDPDRRRNQGAAGGVEDDRPGRRAARKRRSGSGSAPRAIGSSPAATTISRSARACGPRTSRRKRRSACSAEALAESTDWDAAAAEIRRLQAEWKTIGPVKKSRSEAIWQRFRAACDAFFARYAQRHDIARAERVAAREAICAELEALASADAEAAEPPADLVGDASATLRGRWQQEMAARGVDRERAARARPAVRRRVRARHRALAGGIRRHRSRSRSQPQAHGNARAADGGARRRRSRGPAGAGDAALSPTDAARGDAEGSAGGEHDRRQGGRRQPRCRAAADEVRQAQASWSRIGPVPDEARRALADRFQRAIRQISGPGRRPAWSVSDRRDGRPSSRPSCPPTRRPRS